MESIESVAAGMRAETVRTLLRHTCLPLHQITAASARLRTAVKRQLIFADAQTVDVRLLGEPQITLSEGGRIATMRVLLSEVTDSGGRNRPSKARRELRWRKTDESWKIFSERDL